MRGSGCISCSESIDPPPSSSGLLLLGEVEDLAVGLSQVLLLLEVDFERPLDGHKRDPSLCVCGGGAQL